MDAKPELYPGQLEILEFSLEHVTAIASPARSEVFWTFDGREPRSVHDVAQRMGRPTATVHYHVNELARVGLLLAVEERRRGARTERLYVHAGQDMVSKKHPIPDEYRRQAARGFAAIMRILSRERAALHQVIPLRPRLLDFSFFQVVEIRLKAEHGHQLREDLLALLAKYRSLEDPEGTRVRIAAIAHPDMGEIRAAHRGATGADLRPDEALKDL